MKRFRVIGCAAAVASAAAGAGTWTFDPDAPAWAKTVVAEPGAASNRVLRIAADKPHHTRVRVPGEVPAAFVAEARVRVQASTGAAPMAYLYALTRDGFLAATLGSGKLRLFVWRGTGGPSVSIGEAAAPAATGRWVRVRFALADGTAVAKAWADGAREPGWTVAGAAPVLAVNGFAVGAWTSPQTPSTAVLLFDDITLRAALPEDRISAAADGAAPGTLRATFRDGPVTGMVVRATAAAGDDGLVRFRLAVENPTDMAVARILYPGFVSPAALGSDATDDRLLFPHSHTDGIEIDAPGAADRTCSGSYPGDAAVQMAALYDSAAGLLVATQDAEGHCKTFTARAVKDRFVEIAVDHLRPEAPGPAETPYDTVLGSFTGDWRNAAALYKRWARAQPWCARKLPERNDVPQFLKDGAAGVILGIGGPDGYNGLLGPNLEKLPGLAAAYRQRARVPHLLVVPYGWENRGTWVGIHYLPSQPSDEAWRAANAALQEQGDRTAMLTSGFWWVIRRGRTSSGPAFDDTADFERRKAMVVRRADGTPLLSVDQEIGGGQSEPCYATDHGHPPGYGAWMWTGFRDLCNDIRSQARAGQPEIGLFVENCGETIIPVMATYWSRQFGVVDHGVTGGRSVGLFSYLYHEYVTAIGAAMVQGQGPHAARGSPGLRCQALANNLARGLIPCPFDNDAPLVTRDALKAQIARALRVLRTVRLVPRVPRPRRDIAAAGPALRRSRGMVRAKTGGTREARSGTGASCRVPPPVDRRRTLRRPRRPHRNDPRQRHARPPARDSDVARSRPRRRVAPRRQVRRDEMGRPPRLGGNRPRTLRLPDADRDAVSHGLQPAHGHGLGRAVQGKALRTQGDHRAIAHADAAPTQRSEGRRVFDSYRGRLLDLDRVQAAVESDQQVDLAGVLVAVVV